LRFRKFGLDLSQTWAVKGALITGAAISAPVLSLLCARRWHRRNAPVSALAPAAGGGCAE